jgi:hypothetical protein
MDVTLSLSDSVYEQIERAAEKARRPVNDILRDAVAAVASLAGVAPGRGRDALAQMAYLNDAALWQAARAAMSAEQRARLEFLHDQKREQGLGADEAAEESALLALYRETLLVRAQAAVLLKQRGYDVSDPTQFEPLE